MLFSFLFGLAAHAGELHYDWTWETSPDIEICPDSRIETNDVVENLSYWFDRGVYVKIDSIQKVDHCNLNKMNVIQISGATDFDRRAYHAVTTTKWYFYGKRNQNTPLYIDRAIIKIPNDKLDNQGVVLHEFGHALGLGHSHDSIMKATH